MLAFYLGADLMKQCSMNKTTTYTPPIGWVIVGHRIYPKKSARKLPDFENYADKPVSYYAGLRNDDQGFTAIVKETINQRLTQEWLLFKRAPVPSKSNVPLQNEPTLSRKRPGMGFTEEFQISV